MLKANEFVCLFLRLSGKLFFIFLLSLFVFVANELQMMIYAFFRSFFAWVILEIRIRLQYPRDHRNVLAFLLLLSLILLQAYLFIAIFLLSFDLFSVFLNLFLVHLHLLTNFLNLLIILPFFTFKLICVFPSFLLISKFITSSSLQLSIFLTNNPDPYSH